MDRPSLERMVLALWAEGATDETLLAALELARRARRRGNVLERLDELRAMALEVAQVGERRLSAYAQAQIAAAQAAIDRAIEDATLASVAAERGC